MKTLLVLAFTFGAAFSASAQDHNIYRQSLCYPQCAQCNPGECVKTHTGAIPHSGYVYENNPPCEGVTPPEVRAFMHALAAYVSDGATLGEPQIVDEEIERWRNIMRDSNMGGDIEKLLKGVTGTNESSCKTLSVTLPPGATVTRVLTGLDVNGDGAECPSRTNDLRSYKPSLSGERRCPQDFSAFTQPENDGQIWWTIGKNWSHDRNARANFRVFYEEY